MAEETALAVSSTAPAVETVELPNSGTPEYAEWRVTGEVSKPKAVSAPAPKVDEGEATTPPKQQESKRRPDAEARIKELAAETKRLKAELESARNPKTAEMQPKPVQQTSTQEPTPEDKNADGTPKFKTYEEYTKALARWEIKQELAEQERERSQRTQSEEVSKKVKEAEARYPNFKEIAVPTVNAIVKDQAVPAVVKQMLNDSDIWTDLIFTLGSDQKELGAFVEMAKSNPGKAIRYIALTENLIAEELDKGAIPTGRTADGKFAPIEPVDAPAKRGSESAPEPPLEVGNRGSGTMDEAGRALSSIERGNPTAVRDWLRAENAKDLRRRRGA